MKESFQNDDQKLRSRNEYELLARYFLKGNYLERTARHTWAPKVFWQILDSSPLAPDPGASLSLRPDPLSLAIHFDGERPLQVIFFMIFDPQNGATKRVFFFLGQKMDVSSGILDIF